MIFMKNFVLAVILLTLAGSSVHALSLRSRESGAILHLSSEDDLFSDRDFREPIMIPDANEEGAKDVTGNVQEVTVNEPTLKEEDDQDAGTPNDINNEVKVNDEEDQDGSSPNDISNPLKTDTEKEKEKEEEKEEDDQDASSPNDINNAVKVSDEEDQDGSNPNDITNPLEDVNQELNIDDISKKDTTKAD